MLYIVTMLSAVQRMLARFLRPVWLKHNVQKRWLKQRKLAPKRRKLALKQRRLVLKQKVLLLRQRMQRSMHAPEQSRQELPQSGQELVLVKYRQQLREYVLHQP